MNNKSTVIIAAIIVVLLVAVGGLYVSGVFNFSTTSKTQSNSLQSTPTERAPNVVSSQVVSKAFGKSWTMTAGASGSSLNASTYLSGNTGIPLISQAAVSPEVAPMDVSVSPFSIFNVGNNVSYNTYQAGIFVPPQEGFAIVSFAHSRDSSTPGYVVSTITEQISSHFQGKSSYNSSRIHFDSGVMDGSTYIFLAIHGINVFGESSIGMGAWNLEGLLANYSAYTILIIYYVPSYSNFTNFTTILTDQVAQLKAPQTPAEPSVMASASQISSISGLSYKTQSAIALNLNDTKKLLHEYLDLTGSGSAISSTNYTMLNNTIGEVTGIAAKELVSGGISGSRSNITAFAVIGFSNSSAPKTLFDLISTTGNTAGAHFTTYNGWHFGFNTTVEYTGNYVYNNTNGNYTYVKHIFANMSVGIAVNGSYMVILESTQSNSVFTMGMFEQFLNDESTLL